MSREPLSTAEKMALFAIATVIWYLIILGLIAVTRTVL